MAVPYLAGSFGDKATHEKQQPSEDCEINTQHTRSRRDQLAVPQCDSQMAMAVPPPPPSGKAQSSTGKASCDFLTRVSYLTAYLRSRLLKRLWQRCLEDSGICSIKEIQIICHVSTKPEGSFPAVVPSRVASDLSSSVRTSPSVHQSRPSKRSHCNEDESDHDDEEPKAPTGKRAKGKSTQRQFACPFWKLDPNKQRSCYSATLSEIRYVKQHILRRHVQPIHCIICMEIFDTNDDYIVHLRQRPCNHDHSSKLEPQGINQDQKQVLLSWRAKRGSSKEEQWFELWKILFPDVASPSSPFMDEEVVTQPQHEYTSARTNAPRLNRRNKNGSRDLPKEEPRLPCPYYTRFPRSFCSSKWRSCSEPVWPTVDLLKEHIYRCHAAPLSTCPRCREPFDSIMDQVEHLKAEKICIIREESPEMEWLHWHQKQRLQQRSMKTNEADKWREMYLILFPGAEEIPIPYQVEPENFEENKDPAVERYAEYLDRELPRSLRLEMHQKANPGFERLCERTTSQIVDIVRETQLSLFRQYTSSVLCKGDEESAETKSTADTSGERRNFPNLASNNQVQLGKRNSSSARADEFLNSSAGAPTTYPFEEHPHSTIPLASEFDGEHGWSIDWLEQMLNFSTADNELSAELPTCIADSRPLPSDLSTSLDTFEAFESHWLSPPRLDKRDQLNQLDKVGNTALGLASRTEGSTSSAESQEPGVGDDGMAIIEQQESS